MTPERMELIGCIVVFGAFPVLAWIYDTIRYYLDQWGIVDYDR